MAILIIRLKGGKRIQRTRKGEIIVQNDRRYDGRIITKFYDRWNFDNYCIPIPFAEVPADLVSSFRGATPVVSTFAK